jgi:hypothetical protein
MCLRFRALLGGVTGLALIGAATVSPALAVQQTYDFEGLAAGTIVAGIRTNGETVASDPYMGFEFSVIGNGSSNSLCVFDSSNPTGGDFDLGTPNQDFGGPGRGDGGRAGMPGANKTPQGKVLIIPENMLDVNQDGRVDTPDDNHFGGQITIQWDMAGVVKNMVFIDMEEVGGSIDFYLGNQLVQSFSIPAFGDNSQVVVQTMTSGPIDRTVINFPGSGALASMTYDFFIVPIENTTWSSVKNLLR